MGNANMMFLFKLVEKIFEKKTFQSKSCKDHQIQDTFRFDALWHCKTGSIKWMKYCPKPREGALRLT